MSVSVTITPDQLRRLIAVQRHTNDTTTEEAEAFLMLYGKELEMTLHCTVSDFVKRKLS